MTQGAKGESAAVIDTSEEMPAMSRISSPEGTHIEDRRMGRRLALQICVSPLLATAVASAQEKGKAPQEKVVDWKFKRIFDPEIIAVVYDGEADGTYEKGPNGERVINNLWVGAMGSVDATLRSGDGTDRKDRYLCFLEVSRKKVQAPDGKISHQQSTRQTTKIPGGLEMPEEKQREWFQRFLSARRKLAESWKNAALDEGFAAWMESQEYEQVMRDFLNPNLSNDAWWQKYERTYADFLKRLSEAKREGVAKGK